MYPSSWSSGTEKLVIASKNYQENDRLELNRELFHVFLFYTQKVWMKECYT